MNSQEIRNGLEGVVIVRQSVNDGHRGMLGQVCNFRVVAHACYHARGHGGDDERSVIKGLIDAELDVVLPQEHGVATHCCYCCLR